MRLSRKTCFDPASACFSRTYNRIVVYKKFRGGGFRGQLRRVKTIEIRIVASTGHNICPLPPEDGV
jgi:hypothetical protein